MLIPEIEFELDGPEGLFAYIEKRVREQGHIIIVIAEGSCYVAEEDDSPETYYSMDGHSLNDIGNWLVEKVEKNFFRISDLQPFSMK